MTVNGIKAENTELRQEVARLDEALAIEKRRSANFASEKADYRVQSGPIAAYTITRLTAEIDLLAILATDREEYLQLLTDENNKLRAALRECEAELNAYYRMEYAGSHPYSQKKLAQAMASNPATVALSGDKQ